MKKTSERARESERERRKQKKKNGRRKWKTSILDLDPLARTSSSFLSSLRSASTPLLPQTDPPNLTEKNLTHKTPKTTYKKRIPGHRRRLVPRVRVVHPPGDRVPQARARVAARQGRRPARAPGAHLRHQVLASRRAAGRTAGRRHQQAARRGGEVRRDGRGREV